MDAQDVLAIKEARAKEPTMSTWKSGEVESDNLFNGRVPIRTPDGQSTERLAIQNKYRDSIKDAARQVPESTPTLFIDPIGNADTDDTKALLRQAVAMGYWENDHAEQKVPWLAQDILAHGAAFVLSYSKPSESMYPMHQRLAPKGCYPAFFEERLLDLIYVQEMKLYDASLQWPDLQLAGDPKSSETCEVINYLTPSMLWKVVAVKVGSQVRPYPIYVKDNLIREVPVAWSAEFGADGMIEIPFLQIKAVMETQNTFLGLVQRSLEKAAKSGHVANNIVNWQEHGPDVILRPEDNTRPATFEAVQPSRIAPEAFGIYQLNEEALRGSTVYPAARQGMAKQSIISAAGVAAFQGERETLVSYIQNQHLAKMRREQTGIDGRIDVRYLDEEKALLFPVEKLKKYVPSAVWKDDQYRCRVIYTGGGLSKANQGAMAAQKAGTGLWPKKLARRHDPDLLNPDDADRMIREEQGEELLHQAFLSSGNPVGMLAYVKRMKMGMDTIEILDYFEEHPELLQPVPGAGVPGAPGPEQEAVSAPEQLEALEKGLIPTGELPDIGPLPTTGQFLFRG